LGNYKLFKKNKLEHGKSNKFLLDKWGALQYKYIEPILKGKKVLDIGCATGEHLESFHKESIGSDISRPNVMTCRAKGLITILLSSCLRGATKIIPRQS
jgi:2-polyprenyl-3-methyl-5-hydroxy-6-metoxy-1,4-benzoquinol methylase